jgi:hypothetical protein
MISTGELLAAELMAAVEAKDWQAAARISRRLGPIVTRLVQEKRDRRSAA